MSEALADALKKSQECTGWCTSIEDWEYAELL